MTTDAPRDARRRLFIGWPCNPSRPGIRIVHQTTSGASSEPAGPMARAVGRLADHHRAVLGGPKGGETCPGTRAGRRPEPPPGSFAASRRHCSSGPVSEAPVYQRGRRARTANPPPTSPYPLNGSAPRRSAARPVPRALGHAADPAGPATGATARRARTLAPSSSTSITRSPFNPSRSGSARPKRSACRHHVGTEHPARSGTRRRSSRGAGQGRRGERTFDAEGRCIVGRTSSSHVAQARRGVERAQATPRRAGQRVQPPNGRHPGFALAMLDRGPARS